jgi:hypothetical protein
MIPKIIHCVWIGGKPKSEMALKCIKSWKRVCPDYKLVEWNERNFDINSNTYCKQAYEKGKMAFVSDYIRMHALYNQGGVYMDTDVELIKPFNDFLKYPAFGGFEEVKYISTGILGAEKGNRWIGAMLDQYEEREFIKPNGEPDLTTNVKVLSGLTKQLYPEFEYNNTEQHFKDFSIFPTEYFSPYNWRTKETHITKNTVSVHHFSGSWLDKKLGTSAVSCANADLKANTDLNLKAPDK